MWLLQSVTQSPGAWHAFQFHNCNAISGDLSYGGNSVCNQREENLALHFTWIFVQIVQNFVLRIRHLYVLSTAPYPVSKTGSTVTLQISGFDAV